VNRAPLDHSAAGQRAAARCYRVPLDEGFISRRKAERRSGAIKPVAQPVDHGFVSLAEACGRLDQRIQYGLYLRARSADDLQHIARRGLVFERLLEVARALAQFTEQACIFHCDYRLCREILQQRDLFVGEQPNFLAIEPKCAQELVVLAQCYSQSGSGSPQLNQSAARVGRRAIIGRDIRNLHHRYAGSELIERTSWRDRIWTE